MELVVSLMRMIQSYHIDVSTVFPHGMDLYDPLKQIDSMDHFKRWLLDISIRLSAQIRRIRTSSSVLTVSKVEDYIHRHYADSNLSVETISDILHISPSYLSTIFKKEKQESLISYLTNLRMKKAIELLRSSDEKSYRIAEMVGYVDANYFSYVFKKKYGISPTRYRKSLDTV